MVWDPGLQETYYLVATLFQLSLAILILATGRLDAIRAGFGAVVGLGALQTTVLLVLGTDQGWWRGLFLGTSDTAILVTIAFLLSQFPTPLGGERGERWARAAWLGALGVWVPLYVGAYSWLGASSTATTLIRSLPHELLFALAAGLLALHLVPRWLELDEGPLRGQTMLAGAGLAMGSTFLAANRTLRFLNRLPTDWIGSDLLGGYRTGCYLAAGWFTLVIVVLLARAAVRHPRRDTGIFLLVLLVAAGLGVRERLATTVPASELATQALRPILLAGAMLRYDLFQLPKNVRRTAVPGAITTSAVLAFLLTVIVLSPDGLATQELDPLISLGAVAALTGGLLALRRPLAATFRARPDTDRTERLERYRLALERSRPNQGTTPEVEQLRETLGVTEEEHELLASLLDRHVMVPTAAIAGARPGDVIAGRYEVVRELGRGGQGRALLARELRGDGEGLIVLKEILRPWQAEAGERMAELEREARLVSQLDHPNVAEVHGTVEDQARTYLAREHVPGRTLEELLEAEGPLDPEQAAGIARDIAAGLASLHDAGLLHLDLKPANVVIGEEGRAVIIDHGTVQRRRAGSDGEDELTRTRPSLRLGTLLWMAPEQVLEERVDERADVFALGALLYRTVTGRSHLGGDPSTTFEVENEIVHGTAPEDAPEPLGPLVQACLARDPEERPGGAREVQDRLDTLIARVTN